METGKASEMMDGEGEGVKGVEDRMIHSSWCYLSECQCSASSNPI